MTVSKRVSCPGRVVSDPDLDENVNPTRMLSVAIKKRRSLYSSKDPDLRLETLLTNTIQNLCKHIGKQRAARKRKSKVLSSDSNVSVECEDDYPPAKRSAVSCDLSNGPVASNCCNIANMSISDIPLPPGKPPQSALPLPTSPEHQNIDGSLDSPSHCLATSISMDSSMSSAEDTVASAVDTVASAGDTVASAVDTVASAGDTSVPGFINKCTFDTDPFGLDEFFQNMCSAT